MIEKMLSLLYYPNNSIDLNDNTQLLEIIPWLENTYIHKYKPEEGKKILNISSPEWNKGYTKYKKDLGCPVTSNTFIDELIWFLTYSLKLQYQLNKDTYNKHVVENLETANVPNVVADNPLDHLDFGSKDFNDGVKELARVLKIPPHPNLILTHRAASKIVSKRQNKNVLLNPKELIVKGTPFPFESMELGIEFGDEQLNKAAKILHLLYIHDYRDLQTKANELTVAVQTVTANPKTDTKLGRVGMK